MWKRSMRNQSNQKKLVESDEAEKQNIKKGRWIKNGKRNQKDLEELLQALVDFKAPQQQHEQETYRN